MQQYLKKLDEKRKRKGKLDYVFQTYYKKKYKPLAEKTTNDIFKGLAKSDERWKGCSLQYIRNCLISYLFQKDFSVDEIIYITGINIDNISKYISTEDIIKREKDKRKGKIGWDKLYDGILLKT